MNFAIIGASGNVGRKTIEILEKSKIKLDNLFLVASSKSAGREQTLLLVSAPTSQAVPIHHPTRGSYSGLPEAHPKVHSKHLILDSLFDHAQNRSWRSNPSEKLSTAAILGLG